MTLAGQLTIDLDAVVANWRALGKMSNAETAAVIKADAYGCGAPQVGKALADAGCRTFFVAVPSEGAILRQALGPGPTIYILAGYAPPPSPAGTIISAGANTETEARLYPTYNLRPILNSATQATTWFAAHADAPCAVQLDSGMNRLGLEAAELASLGPLPASVQLLMSHLACGDDPPHAQNAAQLSAFLQLTDQHPQIPRSLSATGGILLGTDFHFQMTRPGIGLYGGFPYGQGRAAVALHLPIIQIRDVAPSEAVGYAAHWVARRPSRIATLSAGYADGLIRAMGSHPDKSGATGYLDGQSLPFVGRVSMDLITIDVTDCPAAQPGSMIEILGPNQSIDTLAKAAGSIGHEILTSLGTRYARHYRQSA